jgi:hypothetical protein
MPFKALSGLILTLGVISAIAFAIDGVKQTDNHLKRRQIENCLAPCGPALPALECNTTACACSTFSSAGSTSLSSCESCLTGASTQYGAIFQLGIDVCFKCQNQCSPILTLFLQTLASMGGAAASCDTQCACSAAASITPAELSACTTCLQSVNQSDITVINQLEQQCQSVTLSSSASILQSTSVASHVSTATPTISLSQSLSASATAAVTTTSSKSEGKRTCLEIGPFSWQYPLVFTAGGFLIGWII